MIQLGHYINALPLILQHHRTDSPWLIAQHAAEIISAAIVNLSSDFAITGGIAVHKTARIEEHVIIKAPAIISADAFVAAHAYLRGGVFVGSSAVIGPGTELKSSFVLDGAALAHFNFAGDSIIGNGVNMEAGSVIANHYNERSDKTIHVFDGKRKFAIPVTKFGALVGDQSRVGANAVLSPGTILTPGTIVRRLELVEQGVDHL